MVSAIQVGSFRDLFDPLDEALPAAIEEREGALLESALPANSGRPKKTRVNGLMRLIPL
jgi:hypothetical protein